MVFKSLPLSLIVCALGLSNSAACGQSPKKAISDVKDAFSEKISDARDDFSSWADGTPMRQREEMCSEENGEWVKTIEVSECREGIVTISVDGQEERQDCLEGKGGSFEFQCLHRDSRGRAYFNDGPSVPNLMQSFSGLIDDSVDGTRYNLLFWDAGRAHDYCYHNGQATSGVDKAMCDDRFFNDLSAACANPEHADKEWFYPRTCRNLAASLYAAVRSGGDESYAVMDTVADFPPYTPLWQQLGMESEPADEDFRKDVDDLLIKYNVVPDPNDDA